MSSYLVLARKYRPQTFSDVVGQDHVTRTLQNAIRRGRIHHAFLFCGGRGTGKTTTARILAKALSCEKAPTPEPCNVCQACVEITSGTSVDVQEIDAASQNKVEDIHKLRESIRYAPVRGKKKLYILDEVHMLSQSAFNALLKTLEEPPPHALFVFATTDPHKLPQTILSRVQRYDFKLVPTAKLVEHLSDVLTRENVEFDRGALLLIAREGAGSVRDSLSLLDQVLASCQGRLTEDHVATSLGVADRSLVLELGSAVTARDSGKALEVVGKAYDRGYDLSQLARTFLSHLRDLVVIAAFVDKDRDPRGLLDATDGEMDELYRQAKAAKGAAELLFDGMIRIAEDTARTPLPRYVLEVGMVQLCRVGPLVPLEEMLGRVELLEGRLEMAQVQGGGRPAAGRGPSEPREPRGAGGPAPGPFAVPRAEPPPKPRERSGPEPAAAVAVAKAPAPAALPSDSSVAQHLGVFVPSSAGPLLEFPVLAERLMKEQPLLGALAHAVPLTYTETHLVLLFDNQFAVDQMREKLDAIKASVAQALGRDLVVEIRYDPTKKAQSSGTAVSWADNEKRKQEEDLAQRRREALAHPARKALTEVFGDVTFLEPEVE